MTGKPGSRQGSFREKRKGFDGEKADDIYQDCREREKAMPRVRSPNYPAISLSEAIKRVAEVFAKEHRHLTPKEVVVKHMGYGGVNGASLGALSAARKYGLLDRDGDRYRVSDRMLGILHPNSLAEKAEMLASAARSPELFVEILDNFPGTPPSDENLRSYLIRRGFSQSSLGPVVQAFRETMELAFPDGGAQAPGADRPPPAGEQMQHRTPQRPISDGPRQEPFTVSIGPGGVRGSFDIRDKETLDHLIHVLKFHSLMMTRASDVTRPTDELDEQAVEESEA